MTIKDFELKLGQGDKSFKPERKFPRVPKRKAPTARQALAALKATRGADAILAQVPSLGKLALWKQIASFRVCGKTGTALFLDLWDCDHFDGFTDIPRSNSDCRAWFSADGFTPWGSLQTTTGRVNCFFRAPADGVYVCDAQLESFPASSLSVVECLIDSFSFGPLPFTGLIIQPHVSVLTAGFHHFRIRQQSGGFFFHSLTVHRIS